MSKEPLSDSTPTLCSRVSNEQGKGTEGEDEDEASFLVDWDGPDDPGTIELHSTCIRANPTYDSSQSEKLPKQKEMGDHPNNNLVLWNGQVSCTIPLDEQGYH
jgi:phage terminase large subunit-like protein